MSETVDYTGRLVPLSNKDNIMDIANQIFKDS